MYQPLEARVGSLPEQLVKRLDHTMDEYSDINEVLERAPANLHLAFFFTWALGRMPEDPEADHHQTTYVHQVGYRAIRLARSTIDTFSPQDISVTYMSGYVQVLDSQYERDDWTALIAEEAFDYLDAHPNINALIHRYMNEIDPLSTENDMARITAALMFKRGESAFQERMAELWPDETA